jgi:hypothetical protein
MKITFEESGLVFGPFEANTLFHIEKTNSYLKIQEHTKIAEFLWISPTNKLWIVEAKSSIPRPDTGDYEKYFDEIKSKLVNALALTISGVLKRVHVDLNELPTQFLEANWSNIDFKLILIIPNVPNDHLAPMTHKLRKVMLNIRKPWNIDEISINVLNKHQAVKYGLVTG